MLSRVPVVHPIRFGKRGAAPARVLCASCSEAAAYPEEVRSRLKMVKRLAHSVKAEDAVHRWSELLPRNRGVHLLKHLARSGPQHRSPRFRR